jgi:hypothetical protein
MVEKMREQLVKVAKNGDITAVFGAKKTAEAAPRWYRDNQRNADTNGQADPDAQLEEVLLIALSMQAMSKERDPARRKKLAEALVIKMDRALENPSAPEAVRKRANERTGKATRPEQIDRLLSSGRLFPTSVHKDPFGKEHVTTFSRAGEMKDALKKVRRELSQNKGGHATLSQLGDKLVLEVAHASGRVASQRFELSGKGLPEVKVKTKLRKRARSRRLFRTKR